MNNSNNSKSSSNGSSERRDAFARASVSRSRDSRYLGGVKAAGRQTKSAPPRATVSKAAKGMPLTASGRVSKNKTENGQNKSKQLERSRALTKRDERKLQNAQKDAKWTEGIERIRIGHDWVFFTIVCVLLSVGVIMVYSASYPSALADGLSSFYYVEKQLMWIAVGAAAMLGMAFMPSGLIKEFSVIIFGFGALLLLAVPFIGTESGGAKRWIEISSSFRIQPSEIAKLALVIVLAWYVSEKQDKFRNIDDKKERFKHGVLFPSLFIFGYAFLVLMEKHLSGTLIIVAIGVIIMFLGGADWKMMIPYYLSIGGLGAGAYLLTHPYALERITTFANENADILDENWQTYQGTLAIGSGGFLGLGLGQSRQKHSYVSEAQNDFVFTIWCEEMGFVGALLVVVLFLALVFRGYKIALHAPDMFSSLLVFGIITQVGLQAFLNIMVVTDIIPNTGISLPFLSYGGSSLVMMMAEMGIVLSVSRRSYQKLS